MPSKQPPAAVQTLEKGNILFFYRPKKGVLHPQSPEDMERVFFMLLPDDQRQHKNRVFNVAHGVFPAIVPGKSTSEERDWAFVEDVGSRPEVVLASLEKDVQAPPTPEGTRARPWARAAGEGRYVIARHRDHTHLAYHLAQPQHGGEVQKELEILPEASYVISVKDPFTPSEIQLEKKPAYPADLREKFDGHGWIAVDPTAFLDYSYTQILLIGARADVQKELGLTFDSEAENTAERQVRQALQEDEREAAPQGVSLLKPLEKGRWE